MNNFVGAAIIVLVFVATMHFTGATKTPPAPVPCPDTWYDSAGRVVPARIVYDPATGQPGAPNYGPGQCASPCGPGETPCWDPLAGAGHCVAGPCPTIR